MPCPLFLPQRWGGLRDCCLGFGIMKIMEALSVTASFPESEVASGWPILKVAKFMFLQRTRPWGRWVGRVGGGGGGGGAGGGRGGGWAGGGMEPRSRWNLTEQWPWQASLCHHKEPSFVILSWMFGHSRACMCIHWVCFWGTKASLFSPGWLQGRQSLQSSWAVFRRAWWLEACEGPSLSGALPSGHIPTRELRPPHSHS